MTKLRQQSHHQRLELTVAARATTQRYLQEGWQGAQQRTLLLRDRGKQQLLCLLTPSCDNTPQQKAVLVIVLLSLIHTLSCFFWGNADYASCADAGFQEPGRRTLHRSSPAPKCVIHGPLASGAGGVKRWNSQKHLNSIMFWTTKHSRASGTSRRNHPPQDGLWEGGNAAHRSSSSRRAVIRPSRLAHHNGARHARYGVFPT